MTDVSRFLPKTHNNPSLDDEIQRCIGSFSWTQFIQATLVLLAFVFDSQQTFITVFAEAVPGWHCTYLNHTTSCNQCESPRTAWEWNRPSHISVVSEWDLACAGPLVTSLPATAFFVGCFASGLVLATLADSYLGRKNVLVLSCLIMSLSGALMLFAPNIWVYSVLRFFTGFGRGTIVASSLVLSTELVGKRWRDEVGVMGFFTATVGFLTLPAIAYINKNSSWRTLYLWTSIPGILYAILVHFVVHESPRWLFVQGRREEAIKVVKHLSDTGTTSTFSFSDIEKETQGVDLYSGIKVLCKSRWAFRRLSLVMTTGFGVGLVYYGMPLGVGSLKFDLYLSVTLNALAELPASLITFFLIGKLNRRNAVLAFAILSGICSIICIMVVDKGLQISMELVSYCSASTALTILMIYTLELFPTCVRNSALSMVRQTLVLGGVFSPVLVAAGRKKGFLSYGVFGLVIGCSGFFVVRLPETRGASYCDTMDEQEYRDVKASVATMVGV